MAQCARSCWVVFFVCTVQPTALCVLLVMLQRGDMQGLQLDRCASTLPGKRVAGSAPIAPVVHGSAYVTRHVLMQALAFGWLGRWHEVVAQNFEKAQECYEKALMLDPKDSIAGEASRVQCVG